MPGTSKTSGTWDDLVAMQSKYVRLADILLAQAASDEEREGLEFAKSEAQRHLDRLTSSAIKYGGGTPYLSTGAILHDR